MRKTFTIMTTGDRFESLKNLTNSLYGYLNSGWDIAINFQKYKDEHFEEIKSILDKYNCKKYLFRTNEYSGTNFARLYILDRVDSDIWCNLDDDMEIIPLSNYEPIVDLLIKNKNIGIISSNWARTTDLARRKNIKDELIKQKIVFTGGGMFYRNDVADVFRNMPRAEYLFDNPVWSIYSYVNGYDNYRFLGSVAVHRICTKGGRRTWICETGSKKKLPPEEYITCRKAKNKNKSGFDEYYQCLDSDVTKYADEVHENNKK